MLSPYNERLDEGMGNIAFHLYRQLAEQHNVLHMKVLPSVPPPPTFWHKIRRFHPDIIHVVPGPTIRSLAVVKALRFFTGARTVASTTQPIFSSLSRRLIPLFKPDLVLTQSYESERLFANYGCQVRFLPPGVDIDKFTPVMGDKKQALRIKYDLPGEKFIVLCIGHIKMNRNVAILSDLNRDPDVQTIIVGGVTSGEENEVHQKLDDGGCLVWRKYFENIEELYALADCYVFPTTDKLGSIEMPLSVLEAMSCNLPVLCTRYGALPRIFPEGNGIWYAEIGEDFINLLTKVKAGTQIKTREKVLQYSWKNIAAELEHIYSELLKT